MRKCILVIDVQNDFVNGALGTKEAVEMLPRLVEKLQNEKNASLVFTQDTHKDNYLDTNEGKHLPVRHCIKNTEGWQIAPALSEFLDDAKIIEKKSFGSTRLPSVVAEYDEIELVGLCTDICVISNALLLKAFFPEKKISVDPACCAGVTPESHKSAIEIMKLCQVDINS
ncbi:MAG: cysteine hydrolase [Selenomonadaceae bacterium]|nr:cysteine hydrolase [Selenomonadaceae bacterium]MBR3723523.1 cysteine hydrolase [Selenomonadaceae bacterium]